MGLSGWFNTPVYKEERVRGAKTPPPPTVSNFVTPQSLVSFPVASLVVGLLSAAARTILPPPSDSSKLVPFIVALVVGAMIFVISVRDPTATNTPKSTADWVIAIFIALVNSIFLYMAAIGAVQTVAGGTAA